MLPAVSAKSVIAQRLFACLASWWLRQSGHNSFLPFHWYALLVLHMLYESVASPLKPKTKGLALILPLVQEWILRCIQALRMLTVAPRLLPSLRSTELLRHLETPFFMVLIVIMWFPISSSGRPVSPTLFLRWCKILDDLLHLRQDISSDSTNTQHPKRSTQHIFYLFVISFMGESLLNEWHLKHIINLIVQSKKTTQLVAHCCSRCGFWGL